MLKTVLLTPLTLGVALQAWLVPPVEAIPVLAQQRQYGTVRQASPTLPYNYYSNPIPNYIPIGVGQASCIQGVQQQNTSSYIYGSPIPMPVPVNPVTGTFVLNPGNYCPNYSITTPLPVTGRIENSTLINPTVINSDINNSVLVNPVIVHPQIDGTYFRRSPTSVNVPFSSTYERRSPIIHNSGRQRIFIGY